MRYSHAQLETASIARCDHYYAFLSRHYSFGRSILESNRHDQRKRCTCVCVCVLLRDVSRRIRAFACDDRSRNERRRVLYLSAFSLFPPLLAARPFSSFSVCVRIPLLLVLSLTRERKRERVRQGGREGREETRHVGKRRRWGGGREKGEDVFRARLAST